MPQLIPPNEDEVACDQAGCYEVLCDRAIALGSTTCCLCTQENDPDHRCPLCLNDEDEDEENDA